MHVSVVLVGGPKAGRWVRNPPPEKEWRFDKLDEEGKIIGKYLYRLKNKKDNPPIYEYIGDEWIREKTFSSFN